MNLRKAIFLTTILFFAGGSEFLQAQFYYKDILSNQTNRDYHQLLKKGRVTKIRLNSFEANGQPTEDFRFEQQYNPSYSQLRTITSAPLSGQSSMTNYYNSAGMLYRTTDSSDASFTLYEYQYDSLGRLTQVNSSSSNLGEKIKITESHFWYYDAEGRPVKMVRIKNNTDTTNYQFKKDEKGNIIEEESIKKGVTGEKVYYYYDEQNRLSDIVRYNDRLGKLIPDYMFTWNENGALAEMVSVQNGGIDYLTWRYSYDSRMLRQKELCYNKQKQLVGKLEYEYEFKN